MSCGVGAGWTGIQRLAVWCCSISKGRGLFSRLWVSVDCEDSGGARPGAPPHPLTPIPPFSLVFFLMTMLLPTLSTDHHAGAPPSLLLLLVMMTLLSAPPPPPPALPMQGFMLLLSTELVMAQPPV